MIFYFEKAENKSNVYRYCISIISLFLCVCSPHLQSHLWCLYCFLAGETNEDTFRGARYLHSSMANEVNLNNSSNNNNNNTSNSRSNNRQQQNQQSQSQQQIDTPPNSPDASDQGSKACCFCWCCCCSCSW